MPHSYPFLYKNLDRSASDWAPLTPKAHMEEAFAHPFPGDQRAEPFPEAEEPSREFKHRFTRRFHIQSPNASLTDIHPMPSYAHCRIHSIRSSPIEPFVAPLSTATHSMRSFIAPEQKHPLIGIRQGRLLDKLPPYVPRSMRFIQYTPKQSLLMRAVRYKSRRPLLNARLPTMPRSKSPFRRRAIQYACPEYPPHAPRAIQSRKHPLLDRKSRPTNVERLSIKPCEVSTGLGFNHPKPSIKNVLGARFTQRPLRSRASQPWEQQPSSWADAAREPGWSRRPQPQSPGREQQPSWTG